MSCCSSVYCWGFDTRTNEIQATPLKVKELEGKEIVKVQAGDGISMALSREGYLWMWGDCPIREVFCGTDSSIPNPVHSFDKWKVKVL